MAGPETVLSNWLALLGGASGLAFLVYMGLMLHFARKKDKDIQDVRRDIAELKGIALGRRRP